MKCDAKKARVNIYVLYVIYQEKGNTCRKDTPSLNRKPLFEYVHDFVSPICIWLWKAAFFIALEHSQKKKEMSRLRVQASLTDFQTLTS